MLQHRCATFSGVFVFGLALLTLGSVRASAAATDFRLEINVVTGEVSMVATVPASFAGYEIHDASGHLLDSGGPGIDNEYVLSVAAGSLNVDGAHGNTTPYRNSTNWKNWTLLQDSSTALTELQNIFSPSKPSTFDTISVPAGGAINFGDIFNTATDDRDLQLEFSEPGTNGNPVTGATYGFNGVGIDYVAAAVPEPVLLLAPLIGVALLMRRGRLASV